ncbi:MAG: C-terminal binding protein [Desulfobacteraceae bacterium]|nr:MAG: C-terminal binding protein [Desulfobacteraceae bacterium]
MGFKVVHTYALPGIDHGDALLESLDATLFKGVWLNEDEIISNAKDADAVIGVVSRQPFNRRVLKTLRNCRIIAGIAIGFETVDLEAATEFGIAVTNVPDYCLDEVSGLAIGFILALGRIMLQIDKAVREKQINFTGGRQALEEIGCPIFRMRDQTLGIVGLGKIGTATALKARGLGIKVIAYDPYVFDGVMESHGVKPADFDTLLRESDFISIHTPLTPETHNMFGYEEFKKMKPTCYFINTARGRCVDEPALIKALQEGLIAGAGIDVTVEEPIAADNPLIKMPNVILTGHSAFYSTTSDAELFYKPMTQVATALRGEWPLYGLNPEVKETWLQRWGTVA